MKTIGKRLKIFEIVILPNWKIIIKKEFGYSLALVKNISLFTIFYKFYFKQKLKVVA